MAWDIKSFVGAGPIEFGMTPSDVTNIMGKPLRVREKNDSYVEFREISDPIIRYFKKEVREIEMFYSVQNVYFDGINIFKEGGISVMRRLERMNGGAKIFVGTVLFKNIGITAGRLDDDILEERSITAFARGLWDHDKNFVQISFEF